MKRRGCCFFTLLILVTVWTPALKAEEPAAAPRACVFSVADLSAAGERNAEAAAAASDALSREVEAAGYALVPPEEWKGRLGGRDPGSVEFLRGPAPAEVAKQTGAALAVTGYVTLREDRILLSVSTYDAASGVLVAGFQRSWRYTLAFYTAMRGQVQGALDSLSLPRAQPAREVFLDTITFTSSMEGMEVLLGGEKSAGLIQGGSLACPAAGARAGTPLLVEKRKKGFHTSTQSVATAAEIPLSPLARKTWMSVDACWTLGQLAGAGAALRMYMVPDVFFIAPGLYVYDQPSALAGGSMVLHFDFSTVAGVYLFFPPESIFRLGVSAGIGAVFTTVPFANVPTASDLYVNILNLWAELNLPAFTVFFREEIKYAMGIGYNLLGNTMIMINGAVPPLTAGVSIKL
jgi:hypothetical protein